MTTVDISKLNTKRASIPKGDSKDKSSEDEKSRITSKVRSIMVKDNMDELNKRLDRLNDILEKRGSFWLNFLLGIVKGIGTVIGATLLGGIIIGIIVSNLDKIDRIPVVKEFIDSEQLEKYLDTQDNGN
jgi:tetrahydromethanopterin S-methyltransferase subunit G